jgi:uroporphyrinogen decarboxylase
MAMTQRERVWTTLNHKEPDRIPIDLGGTEQSSICKMAYIDLMKYLGFDIDEGNVAISNLVQQLPVLDQRLLDWVGVCAVPLLPNPPSSWKLEIMEEGDYWTFVDEWGAKLFMPKSGYYYDYREFPMKESTWEAFRSMKWPDAANPARIKGLREKAKDLYENTEYAIAGTSLFGGGIFEHPARYHGMPEFLMLCAADPKLADAMMGKVLELFMEATERYLNEVGEYIQVFAYWDDITSQDGPIVSPNFYRKYVKPKQRQLCDLIKSKTKAKIYLHCCGACYEFIGDFIEAGFDILNPVQVNAKGMGDTAKLKREFGKDIVFWGGIDTQRILPFGTPRDVKEEVKRRINDLTPGGGFVFNTSHNIQNFVPPENIVAMYETARELGKY